MPGDFDLVKEKVDIVQLIGEHVPLKKAGRIYKALCPFHAEKTPSFTVDPERRTYKCFGCGEGGDVFTFLEKKEGLEPAEALQRLAERAGVELTRRRPEEREVHARLLAAHEVAYFYFRQALRGTPSGRDAAAYLARRGLRPDTVERFGLGYAPNLRDGLLAYLRRKGYSDDEAAQAGLIVKSERGLLDRFRDRLIVPIRDGRGRPIAFGGRALRADQSPKYLNSPATPLFDKSATLYALDLARSGIRKAKQAVVVEGYFDAIAAHQAGIDNVVASMGTALTPQQYEVLRPLAESRAIIAFDADPAGKRAAESRGRDLLALAARMVFRGRAAAASVALELRVAVLPPGVDPDELIRKDLEAFRRALAEARTVVEFLLDVLEERHDLGNPLGRQSYLAEALPLLAELADPVEWEPYVRRVAWRAATGEELVRERVRRSSRAGRAGQDAVAEHGGKQKGTPERYLVAQLLRAPHHFGHTELSTDDVSDPDLRAMLGLISGGKGAESFPEPLRARALELTAEVEVPQSEDDLVTAIELAALRVRERGLRRKLEEVRALFARDEANRALGVEVERLTSELERVMQARERRTVLERAAVEGK